jgi:hypothetical protein
VKAIHAITIEERHALMAKLEAEGKLRLRNPGDSVVG